MKKYGIRVTLPKSCTLLRDHLLGDNWESFRWYHTSEERDKALVDMNRQPSNYRKGDTIMQELEKVER